MSRLGRASFSIWATASISTAAAVTARSGTLASTTTGGMTTITGLSGAGTG